MEDIGQELPRTHAAGEDGDRAQRAACYDPRRAQARLALIEQQVTLARTIREHEDILARQPTQVGRGDPWEAVRISAEQTISDAERWVNELGPHVGDPEAVVDEHGWLPSERRERFLTEFTTKFDTEVRDLRERVPALPAELKLTRGRRERAAIREELNKTTARLAYLETVPSFTAPDMCSECPWPMSWHDVAVTICMVTGATLSEPCPAWPVWRETMRIGFARAIEMMRTKKQLPPPEPVLPQPLGVISSGASVEETIAQLTAIQAEHPGARVRRGKGNCWEIWAASTPG